MLIKYFLSLILSISLLNGFSQINCNNTTNGSPVISRSDSLLSESLPLLVLPDEFVNRDLPAIHDNSGSPYLRPVFNQNSSCCGQASGVAYNFTYEINRLRNLPSSDTLNQYPSHFTWNFMNSGDGYFGVSYLHSFEILKVVGNPNVFDYGGMDLTTGVEWMNGYEKYYNAMHNRIRDVSQLKVNTQQGLLTLKHWLQNHLEGSVHGGVASFYAASPWGYHALPADSPESGKLVMTAFPGAVATHAMTIVGYHDSIRYDYNNDGQYTNHIDLNNDGMIDMKDREIGGLKFVNSYGPNWADSGFCYMMYKTLADNLGQGGIWNHCIHVLDVKQAYEPLLTLKFTIKHDSREKIKITAGVATDTAALIPQYVMHFPAFNYQGSNNYMQGGRWEEIKKYLEAGLDITPLLSFVNPSQPAKFFLQVTETDPLNEGTGRIIGLTLMDYNNDLIEIPCTQTDVALVENGVTRLGIVYAPTFDKVEIATQELPPAVGGNCFATQIEAQNGSQPYKWNLITPYYQQRFDFPMPEIDDEQLFAESTNEKFAFKKIEFEFPFFGKKYDTIYMHQNGFLMFEPDLYPWPYFNDPGLLFRKVRNISAFHFAPVQYYNDPLREEPEMWFEGNESYAAFRWNGPLYYFDNRIGNGEFALVLNVDGKVDFYYNNIEVDENVVWYAGVSAGNETDYTMLKNANSIFLPEVLSFTLIPENGTDILQISNTGLLTGTPEMSEQIVNLSINVSDDSQISTTKIFQLSDGLIFTYNINAGTDGLVECGEEFTIDLTVKNIFDEAFHNVSAHISDVSPFLELLIANASIGDIAPSESKTIAEAFVLKAVENCPNNFNFYSSLELSSDEADWYGKLNFKAFSPSMMIISLVVHDNNNNRLDPGETVDVDVTIANDGILNVENIQIAISTSNNLITINDPLLQYGSMTAGEEKSLPVSVSAQQTIAIGDTIEFDVQLTYAPNCVIDQTYQITIGQYTAVVFNKSSHPASSQSIFSALEQLGVDAIWTNTLPAELELFRSVFVCLGTIYQNVALTQEEAAHLQSYLGDGGNIYLEGTMTWTFDQQTTLHPMFKAGAQSGSFLSFDKLTGVSGSFTEGLNFEFAGPNSFLPCLMNPVNPAFPIFYADSNDQRCIATANPDAAYKTIGAIHEFGLMGDENNVVERRNYLYKILEFFGLEDYVTQISECCSTENPDFSVYAFPNPFTNCATLKIDLKNKAQTDVEIYNLTGKKISQIISQQILPAGKSEFLWQAKDDFGRNIPPGIYIYRVKSGDAVFTGKLIRMVHD